MPSRKAKDLLPKRKEAPKKSEPKKDDTKSERRKPEPTLPPDPHADQMSSATGMSGSTNPRQGQPY